VNLVAAAHTVASDHCNHGFAAVADGSRSLDTFPEELPTGRRAELAHLRNVAGGAKRLLTRAREHNDADTLVVAGVIECERQFVKRFRAKCIQHLRPVDCYARDTVLFLIRDVLKFHFAILLKNMG
jgi:hypothetical protein